MKQSSPWFHKLLAIYYLVQGLLLIAVGVGGLVLWIRINCSSLRNGSV